MPDCDPGHIPSLHHEPQQERDAANGGADRDAYLMEVFGIGRATVYRTIERGRPRSQ
jgi:hypothetical protein